MVRTLAASFTAAALLLATAAPAAADPGPGTGGGQQRDIDMDVGLPGGGMVLILCPGVGGGANILSGLGAGGWCDYGFSPGGAHIHCAWGGSAPFAGGWRCWRVFRGQPDNPELPDPDIVPDGSPPRPDALWGPSPDDQAPHESAPEEELPAWPPGLPAIGGR